MKKIFFLFIFLLQTTLLFADRIDVVFLKNGSIIRGEIIEFKPSENLKIRTIDGRLLEYSTSEIDIIKKGETLEEVSMYLNNINNREDSHAIIKRKGRLLWKDGSVTNEQQTKNLLGNDLYNTMISAERQVDNGNNYLFLGGVCVAATILELNLANNYVQNENWSYEGFVTLAYLTSIFSETFICLGCVFRGIGNGRLNWVMNTYNSLPVTQKTTIKLNPSLLLSSKSDLALGATISINF